MYSQQQNRNNLLTKAPKIILMAMIGITIMLEIIQPTSIILKNKLVDIIPLTTTAMITNLITTMVNKLLSLQKFKIR